MVISANIMFLQGNTIQLMGLFKDHKMVLIQVLMKLGLRAYRRLFKD